MAEKTQELKKWELKVALHCEGCARKVKKSLQSIGGVYKVTVDSAKSRVTVEGESKLNPDVLVKKLTKIGKPAELLQAADPKHKSSSEEKPATAVIPQKVDGNKEAEIKKTKKKEAQDASGSTLPGKCQTDHVKCSASNRPDLSQPQPPESVPDTMHPSNYHYQFVQYHQLQAMNNPYAVQHSLCPGQSAVQYYAGAPPPPDPLRFNTDMFNDENTNSCTLM